MKTYKFSYFFFYVLSILNNGLVMEVWGEREELRRRGGSRVSLALDCSFFFFKEWHERRQT